MAQSAACKKWYDAHGKENYAKHSAQYQASAARYKGRLKSEAFAMLGGACSVCGEADWRVLDIHHINGDGKAERNSPGTHSQTGLCVRIINKGTDGLTLLCANDHRRAHAGDVTTPTPEPAGGDGQPGKVRGAKMRSAVGEDAAWDAEMLLLMPI